MTAGCSSSKQAQPAQPSGASPGAASTTADANPSTVPVQVGISPDGVTTSLSAPAGATEEEYYQACHWAKVWIDGQSGDRHALIEPYLKMVQASPTGENGTWNKPWAQLAPEQQSGLIVAVTAAADGGCD